MAPPGADGGPIMAPLRLHPGDPRHPWLTRGPTRESAAPRSTLPPVCGRWQSIRSALASPRTGIVKPIWSMVGSLPGHRSQDGTRGFRRRLVGSTEGVETSSRHRSEGGVTPTDRLRSSTWVTASTLGLGVLPRSRSELPPARAGRAPTHLRSDHHQCPIDSSPRWARTTPRQRRIQPDHQTLASGTGMRTDRQHRHPCEGEGGRK